MQEMEEEGGEREIKREGGGGGLTHALGAWQGAIGGFLTTSSKSPFI